ncbi:hypothetical protein E6C76_02875 [Pseudothauera nasutitermitis]|uniref:Uncharacterized protein n=1 Tax=Pseudothauera nasutitermitis TaxID=2565930 RepID=A0A4V3WCI7_9RHOO|nr:hypothetical protein [Pseudothauera nasutitermitis]THF67334.1 hypothetical protein E6C76_02875 [Pseudothauera nasutitermitis]
MRPLWIALAAAIFLGGAAYLYQGHLLPQPDLVALPDIRCAPPDGFCAVLPEGGRIELRFTPHPPPAARPFQVRVATTGLAAHRVDIEFAGVDMDMGPNRLTLAASANGIHEADATLPACISGPMAWRATLTLHTRARRILVPYEFHTGDGDTAPGPEASPT